MYRICLVARPQTASRMMLTGPFCPSRSWMAEYEAQACATFAKIPNI
jgi:hypothetical protein